MPRRFSRIEEPDSSDRWMVSYADFITLLFAFFVVMYAVASLNDGQHEVLSDSILGAFRHVAVGSGDKHSKHPNVFEDNQSPPSSQAGLTGTLTVPKPQYGETTLRRVRDIADEIRKVLEPIANKGQITVHDGVQGVSVEINANMLFSAGDATLSAEGLPALLAVAGVLNDASFPISIEGHSDNLPIANWRYPSNWELSSARAASVVRMFIDAGVDPARLSAVGHADQRPIADNSDDVGRARNRRVTLYIESRFIDPSPLATPGQILAGDLIGTNLPVP